MDSGARHSDEHRPMYPEYPYQKSPMQRNLYLLEGYRFYDHKGKSYPVTTTVDVLNFLADHLACAYTHSFTDYRAFPYLDGMVRHSETKIISNKNGIPHLERINVSGSSRWIVQADTWNEIAEPSMLDRMWDFFEFVDEEAMYTGGMKIGWSPTPSSHGRKLMHFINFICRLPRHTSVGLSCEQYIREHMSGAIAITPGVGQDYEVAAHLDQAAAYIAKWTLHPAGPVTHFRNGHADYPVWFAECKVDIHSELPLGPFPIRRKKTKDWSKRVDYPTLPGSYTAYLWSGQADDAERAGCTVRPITGWGWHELTSDNMFWAEWAYDVREAATTEHVKEKFKSCLVGGVGRHGSGRTHYILVDEEHAGPNDRCVTSPSGEPLAYFVHEEFDNNTALMVHWNNYTVTETNRSVYQFALPYAMEGRLIMIDTDSVIVLETDEGHRYAKKIPKSEILLGQWYYTQLHDLHVLGHRKFKSLEITRLPGVRSKPYVPGFA